MAWSMGVSLHETVIAPACEVTEAITEKSMNRAEAMKDGADAASRDCGPGDEIVVRVAPAASWDPHEVWLTRVKQPRERAARAAAAREPGRTKARHD